MTDRVVFAIAAVAVAVVAGLVALVIFGHADAAGIGLCAVLMLGFFILG